VNLLTLAVTAAQPMAASSVLKLNAAPRNVVAQANFLYGLAGTNVAAYLQTSIDGGATWIDIAQWTFAATSGRLVYNLNAQTPLVAARSLVGIAGTLEVTVGAILRAWPRGALEHDQPARAADDR
jgi:hypothetical protein